MSVFNLVDVGFILLHSTALGLNTLTLYLINRIGLKEIDTWLGVIMAACDIFLSVYKISHLLITALVEKHSFLFNVVLNAPICGFVTFAVRWSTVSVGYLGIVRWLVICRKVKPTDVKRMKLIYFGHIIVLIATFVLCYCFGGFRATPGDRYFLPDWRITNLWGFSTSQMMTFNLLLCFFAFNGSYILITRQYLHQLNVTISSSQLYHHRLSFQREKLLIVIKIALMLFLYNFTLVPPLIVSLMELITGTSRTASGGLISYASIACIALVNPMVLITMHCETWNTFQNLFSSFQTHLNYPQLTEPDSIVTPNNTDIHHTKPLQSYN